LPFNLQLSFGHVFTALTECVSLINFPLVLASVGYPVVRGGPMKFDSDGQGYDEHMRDTNSGLASGGENGFDGKYF
jgi:hypothetical protein